MSFLTQNLSTLSLRIRVLEDALFDWTRGIDTSGDPMVRPRTEAIGVESDGYAYLPARAKNIRQTLRLLPISDPACYTFVDLGSGKGRGVFLAAELPFRSVIGVEHSVALHQTAEENLCRLRRREVERRRVQLICGDAGRYDFPDGNLVLYLFNPFGPEVMGRVLKNVQAAIHKEDRHVVISLLWPELSKMVAGMPGVRRVYHSRRVDIFSAGCEAKGSAR